MYFGSRESTTRTTLEANQNGSSSIHAVIGRLEQELVAAVYSAEWLALGEGKDPNIYRSFTSRETWTPLVLMVILAVATVGFALVALGVLPTV